MATQVDAPPRASVLHSTKLWLPQTMTWLYTQVRNLPPRVTNVVVCESKYNLDQFDVPNLIAVRSNNRIVRYLEETSWSFAERRRARVIDDCASRFGCNLLHSHFGDYGHSDIGNAARAGLRHVVTFYGYDASLLPYVDPRWNERYASLFSSVTAVLCEGPYMAAGIVRIGCPASKVHVHHLGVSVDRIRYAPRRWEPGERLRFLIAGSFTEKKGFPYAIEALGRLRGKLDFELTVIGNDNGSQKMLHEKARINAAIDNAGLRDRTEMLGIVPYTRLLDEAYRHHVFLQPSVVASDGDSEGGAPVSIIDMLATGMPVIATRHCDIPEVMPPSHAHLLAPERDVDGLEERLTWLIDNPSAWSALIQDGRNYVEAEFNAVTQGERLATFYESLVAPGSR